MRRRACLILASVLLSTGAAIARVPDSGISGRIVDGPVCPVQSVPPRPGCAPPPLRATLHIRRARSQALYASVRSSADGRFRVRLPPGTYVVGALAYGGSPLPRPPAARRVQVHPGRYTHITITYDTGIR